MTLQILQIILEVTLIILGIYLSFVKSYFQEKGKNLATLQDIEEITKKVETIKTEFIRETEEIKLKIQYKNQIAFTLKTEEIKSLFDFYEKYYLWLNILLDYFFGGADEDNIEILTNSENIINDSYFKFLLAEAKVGLLIDNKELFEHTYKMKISTLKFQNFVLQTNLQIKHLLTDIKHMKDTTPIENQIQPYSELLDKKKILIQKYNENKLEHYKEIAPMNKIFQNLCFNLLSTMSLIKTNDLNEKL